MSNLPASWTVANLFDVCQPKQWKTISTKELLPSGYPVYGANGEIGFYNQYTHEVPTLMITCRGATCGNLHVSKPFSYINGNAMALDNLREELCGLRYLHRYLQARGFKDTISGSAQPQITQEGLRNVEVVIAPLPEQRRITDKLDTVLARVDAVNEHLARVAPLLKRLRQSVLAAATSGRLTEDWRLQNGGSESTPLALGSLVVSIDQGWSPKCEPTAAPPGRWAVIKTTAIQPLMFLPDENKELPESLEPRPNLALEDGDVLITRAGPRSRAGIACIVRGAHPRLMLCDKAYRVRVDQSKICSDMLNLLLNSPSVLDAIDQMKTGISESGVNLTQTKFRELRLEVPPIEEQTEIVRRVELLFAYADRLEARLRAAHTATERLTPALLAKAFRGELVPQDPNDEPAAQLLQRLQASQATAAPKRRKARAAPAVQD